MPEQPASPAVYPYSRNGSVSHTGQIRQDGPNKINESEMKEKNEGLGPLFEIIPSHCADWLREQ